MGLHCLKEYSFVPRSVLDSFKRNLTTLAVYKILFWSVMVKNPHIVSNKRDRLIKSDRFICQMKYDVRLMKDGLLMIASRCRFFGFVKLW